MVASAPQAACRFPLPAAGRIVKNFAGSGEDGDLGSKGITVPFPDALIATLGIENDIEVWARDPHFPMMQKVLPQLQLFQEPP